MLSKNWGKKSIHHHRGTPLFSVCLPTLRSQSKKSYGVYHFPGKTREKGLHHRSGKKGKHHRASDPEKKKRRVSTVVVYPFFFPEKEPQESSHNFRQPVNPVVGDPVRQAGSATTGSTGPPKSPKLPKRRQKTMSRHLSHITNFPAC